MCLLIMKNFVVKNIPESSSEWELKKPEKNQLSKSVENTDKFENSDENVVLLRGTYLDDMTSGKPSFFPF